VLLDARPLQGETGRRGVGAYVRELARGTLDAARDVELVMLTDSRLGALIDPPRHERIDWSAGTGGIGPGIVRGFLAGPRWTRRARVDLVHATFLAPPRVPRGVPLLATVHDLIPLEYPELFALRHRLSFRMSLSAAARADGVIAVSEVTADAFVRRFRVDKARVEVIPPPVNVERFASCGSPGIVGLDGSYLLHLGGFDPLKGVLELLLPAFARASAGRPGFLLALTGSGPGRVEAERLARELGIEDRVRFVGHLEGELHAAAVAGAAAVVVSSRAEGFGIPVIEALAAGVPVAVGPAPASREAAAGHAELAPDDSPEALADAIARALAAAPADSPAGRRRRAHARSFAPEVVGQRVVEIYRSLAEGGATR
jgi:glycosyltransferase involved in cell wall biosynthesis